LNLELNTLSKTRAKRSSSETLPKQSAHDAEWNGLCHDNTDLFSEMLEETLNCGHSIRFRAPGDSMYPTICDGDLVTVEPIKPSDVIGGDIILYRHKSRVTAHRVMRIYEQSVKNSRGAPKGPQDCFSSETLQFFLRGDAAINADFPVHADQILGKVVSVERNGRCLNPYDIRINLLYRARRLAARLKKLLIRPNSRPA
jgi:signal peptidase I